MFVLTWLTLPNYAVEGMACHSMQLHLPETRMVIPFNSSSKQEVSILKNSEPHDLVLQLRGGTLQDISDLNPKGMSLHFTLLFPYGTMVHMDGTQLQSMLMV